MNYNVNNLVKCISYKTIIYEFINIFSFPGKVAVVKISHFYRTEFI